MNSRDMAKLPQFRSTPSGAIKSEGLERLRKGPTPVQLCSLPEEATTTDELMAVAKMCLAEMVHIEGIAKDLGGDPRKSLQYLQAEATLRTINKLFDLVNNTYQYVRSTAEAKEETHD